MSTIRAAAPTRVPRWLPWLSGGLLVAGVLAVLIAYDVGGIRNTANVDNPPVRNEPADVPVARKTVPMSREAADTAIKFIDGAVTRKNLAGTYALAAPEIRRGMTLAQWKKGDIYVEYFPVSARGAGYSPYRVEWSYENELMLRLLLTPTKASGLKPQEFFVGIKKVGTPPRWAVFYFAPRSFPKRPTIND